MHSFGKSTRTRGALEHTQVSSLESIVVLRFVSCFLFHLSFSVWGSGAQVMAKQCETSVSTVTEASLSAVATIAT